MLKGDATGYAYAEDFSWEKMAQAARTAGRSRRAAAHQPRPIEIKPGANLYAVERFSVDEPPAGKLELLTRADRAARAADPRIVKCEVSLAEERKEILIVSSDGRMVRDQQPLVRFGVRAVAEDGKKRQSGSSGGGGRIGLEYFEDARTSPEAHGRERSAWPWPCSTPGAPAGEMEVVLGPGDSGILLHEAVGHGLEADFARKKTSNYTDRVGQPVASPLCTVVDDGTIGLSRGSIHVDDEGWEGRQNVLIEKGILVDYMHDRLSSQHFKRSTSGNGRRQSFRHMPLPRMTNTLLMGGEHSPDEIVRSVKRGILAKRFSGGIPAAS